ncbi:MAG: L-histidine N(alpha)-methyltransferase [Methylovirgula sp.]
MDGFRSDVLAGLARRQKTLPSRWLYDERGSELFEAITKLEEYYLTRTETAILKLHAVEIAKFCGSRTVLLEYGAGAGIKTQILIDALQTPRLYVPIDLAEDFLERTVARMRQNFPLLEVSPIVADFNTDFEIPPRVPRSGRMAFFPGSTIGNLDRGETISFLRQVRNHVGEQGGAVIGVDLKKDIPTLLAAYDDDRGVTAAFNLNLLTRINRELGADFLLEQFVHEARWNDAASAVEMHLVSVGAQTVTIDGRSFGFEPGETIHTESSRKYDLEAFADLAKLGGWRVGPIWTDAAKLFALFALAPVF